MILRLSENSIDVYSGDDLTAAHWMLAGAKGDDFGDCECSSKINGQDV